MNPDTLPPPGDLFTELRNWLGPYLVPAAWAAGGTLLFAVAGIVALRLLGKLSEWLTAEGRLKPVRFRSVQLLPSWQIARAARLTVLVLKILAILLLFYLWLSVILSAFPATERIGIALTGLILDAIQTVWDGVTGYIPNLLQIALILFVTKYVIRLLSAIFTALEQGNLRIESFDPEWVKPTYQIVRFLVFAFALVTIFPLLPGHESKALQGATIFFGVLFTLASGSSVSNLVAGILLVYMRSFRLGDWIQVGDVTGEVFERNLLVTRLRTSKEVEISIPNASILSGSIQNFSRAAQSKGVILFTSVTIGYDVPWRKIHELLIVAARKTPEVEKEPAPFVLQKQLNDFYVEYELNIYTRRPGHYQQLYSTLHQNIQDEFFNAGVEIMSPHYTALRDGNTAAIPEEKRPAGYRAPAFRISKDE